MKPCILFSSVVLAVGVASCAVTESTESPPPAVELSEEGYALNGASCGNGVAEAGEVCLTMPSATVIGTGGEQVHTVLTVYLDNDLHLDLVAMTRRHVLIRYGLAAGGFGPLGGWFLPGAQYMDIAAVDFDGDGDLDLALANQATGVVGIRRNFGGFVFPVVQVIPVGLQPTRILAARLDGNTRDDLIVLETDADVAAVLLANDVDFFPPVFYPVGDAPDIAVGDCNADAAPDLIYVNGSGVFATLRAHVNFGGAFGPPVVSPLTLFDDVYGLLDDLAIVSVDLDGNGRDDAVVSTQHSQLPSAIAGGNCLFTPASTPGTQSNTYAWSYRLRTVDWDVDSNPDIVAPHGLLGEPDEDDPDHWSFVFGDGTGAFASGDVVPETPGIGARDVAFADVDNDGDLDALLGGFNGVTLHRNWR
jgi:hypothetical protein